MREAWAVLAFESTDLQQDEAVTTSAFMADQIADTSVYKTVLKRFPVS